MVDSAVSASITKTVVSTAAAAAFCSLHFFHFDCSLLVSLFSPGRNFVAHNFHTIPTSCSSCHRFYLLKTAISTSCLLNK